MNTEIIRCGWAGGSPLMVEYHDTEWGVPVHDDTRLFEFLILEGAQAGLSWQTVLQKRESYREAFDGFDATKIACYTEKDVARLMANPGIIRNQAKIRATIGNARSFLTLREQIGSFDQFLQTFIDGSPIQNQWESHAELPAKTPVSDSLSKALLARGFKFVGSTICYAFMQAVGMVNDHTVDCFRYSVYL